MNVPITDKSVSFHLETISWSDFPHSATTQGSPSMLKIQEATESKVIDLVQVHFIDKETEAQGVGAELVLQGTKLASQRSSLRSRAQALSQRAPYPWVQKDNTAPPGLTTEPPAPVQTSNSPWGGEEMPQQYASSRAS